MIALQLPSGPLRIVCLGAHPDDVEIGCGGTLLTLAESRDVRAVVVVATGSGNRHEEAMKSLPRFLPGTDVEVRVMGLRDGFLPTHWGALKEALEQVSKSMTADLVFAPRPDDAHQDHRLIAELAPTAWRDALVLNYEIPKWDGDLGTVTHYVPLEPRIAHRKVELLHECFPSQAVRDWWDDETFLAVMRMRGIEARTRYAEGFRVTKVLLSLDRGRDDG
jgi:LmbE family N-acetylglucosaminyl deacetylase